ncbi:alpha/beta hydrolase family protein [Streptomyces sp. NPDC058308]|uniref:alpha/beta hydrolase family protein n=1 Tax=Streptomyces sp. NPDC058308 TaxID=3346440 RepID=UPI0036E4A7B3
MPDAGEAMFDPVAADPAVGPGEPATTPPLHIRSAGEALLGLLHLPPGPGPHPTAVLLHGFPGNERNFDLAQALRRAGYAALVFHYRGSWGVGGVYSWRHVLEDSARVVAALREPAAVAEHRLDPDRLAVVGHSMGGFAALLTAAADPRVRAVASVAGFDLGAVGARCRRDPAARAAFVGAFGRELLPLRGTSGEALVVEAEDGGADWELVRLAPRLTGRPVLLVGAGRDQVAPVRVHHDPVVAAYRAHAGPRLEHRVFATDHSLSDCRVALARTVIDFLDRGMGAAPDSP